MRVINQPWDGYGKQLGDRLVELLMQDEPVFSSFRLCVAFAKASGVLRLAPAMQSFMERGGNIEAIVGVDEGITTKQALELLSKYSTTAYVFQNPAATFHPKVYLFEASQRAVCFIGSSNLTTGGLFTNYEVDLEVELDLTLHDDQQTYLQIKSIFSNLTNQDTGNTKTIDSHLIKELTQSKIIKDETKRATAVRKKASSRDTLRWSRLFRHEKRVI